MINEGEQQQNWGEKRKKAKYSRHQKLLLDNNLKIKGIELRDKMSIKGNTEERSLSTENKRVLSHNKNILNNISEKTIISSQTLREERKG